MTQLVRSQKTGLLVTPEQALKEEREMREAQRRMSTFGLVGAVFAWMLVVGGIITVLLK